MASAAAGRRRGLASRALATAGSAAPPQRWLPTNAPSPAASPSPRPGWQAIEKWRDKAAGQIEPVTGCSALVRTLRRALRPPPGARPTPQSFWRRAAVRSGHVAEFLSTEESCEVLGALADARLQWEGDPPSTKGLQKFAAHASRELGSFSPAQVGDLAWAVARLDYQDEELLQAFSRAVEHTVRAERGRLSNDAACRMLAAYRRLRVLDDVVMRSLSRLICRRLVREPLTPQQTAGVAAAFAELRARDVALFNATTLALCRRDSVEELSYHDIAQVALAYASLRLHSPALFARIRARLCQSAGLLEEEDSSEGVGAGEASALDQGSFAGGGSSSSSSSAGGSGVDLWDQLSEPAPAPPPVHLAEGTVARLLQAHLHLGRLSARDLAPLLPHLAHPEHSRPGRELAALLAVALGRGGHAWPWLWRRAAVALAENARLPPPALLSLAAALAQHLELLRPLLAGAGRRRRRGAVEVVGGGARTTVLAQHQLVLAGALVMWWRHLAQQCRACGDLELQQAAAAAARLTEAQAALVEGLSRQGSGAAGAATGSAGDSLRHATAQAARRLGTELAGRRRRGGIATDEELSALLAPCGVDAEEVLREAQLEATDLIHPGAP